MKRVLLKLSGEALAGEQKRGFDEATVTEVAKQIKTIVDEGLQVGIVIGGGNFWRGRTSGAMDRSKADQIGMLATIMNCIYVSDICRYVGLKTEVFTPFVCGAFTTLYSKDAVEESFAEGKVVFFAGGTGHPYFSTDTATVLRAVEIGADAILLAKAVDGIYDSDPKVNPGPPHWSHQTRRRGTTSTTRNASSGRSRTRRTVVSWTCLHRRPQCPQYITRDDGLRWIATVRLSS